MSNGQKQRKMEANVCPSQSVRTVDGLADQLYGDLAIGEDVKWLPGGAAAGVVQGMVG